VKRLVAAAAVIAAVTATADAARAQAGDPLGHTTVEQTVAGSDPAAGFAFLVPGPGDPYVVREELGAAQKGRARRRGSLAFFGQLSDFQLADEESPARVEFLDFDPSGVASAAWRPQEALVPHQVDWSIRQMNRFRRSPVRQRGGKRARTVGTILTGDLADSQQRNETEWVVRLIEGGTLHPNSGTTDLSGAGCLPGAPLDDPAGYTGVQDYDDYDPDNGNYYDPDQPAGLYADWPSYPGLLDRAQQPFEVAGLKTPSWVAFGNHDGLVQGNEDATAATERISTGCAKPIGTQPPATMLVPPDPARQNVDKQQYKALFDTGRQRDVHGFGLVDAAELEASAGTAMYYSWAPRPGVRFIVLDTVSEGGVVAQSSEGNVDDPQFRWLEAELQAATDRDEVAVILSHHAPASLTSQVPDESAQACTAQDDHGHDVNPGCDRDPRSSQPIHGEDDLVALLHRFPHAIAWVAGHSHRNTVEPYQEGEGGFWSIRSASEVDWPPQNRLLEVMDNCDATLSVFTTLLDAGGPVTAPAPGTDASTFDSATLASVARTLSYNDPQLGFASGAQGEAKDRNVELVVDDPRTGPATIRKIRVRVARSRLRAGRRIRLRVRVTDASGAPVAGARVRIAGRRATTNAKGRAKLKARLKGRGRVAKVKAAFPNACRPKARAKLRVRRGPARAAPAG
jgi:metallophosphoesterase (TIGR03767 family)